MKIVFTAGKHSIRLTKPALEKLSALPKPLRLRVDGGGCNGYQYRFLLADSKKPEADDIVFGESSTSADVNVDDTKNKIFVDKISMEFLDNIQLDYVHELIGETFRIADNPNASSECGCKISFESKT